MATKPSALAERIAQDLHDKGWLKGKWIERQTDLIDTHLDARDRKIAEALVNEHGVDLALDGDAWRLNIGAATKDDLVECITAAIERAREEVGE